MTRFPSVPKPRGSLFAYGLFALFINFCLAAPPEAPEVGNPLIKNLADLGGNLPLPALDEDLITGGQELPDIAITWGACAPSADQLDMYYLEWTHTPIPSSSSVTLDSFLVQRRDGPGEWKTINKISEQVFFDWDLLGNRRYHYRIVPLFSIANHLRPGKPSPIHVYQREVDFSASLKYSYGAAPTKGCPPGFARFDSASHPDLPRLFRTKKTTEDFDYHYTRSAKHSDGSSFYDEVLLNSGGISYTNKYDGDSSSAALTDGSASFGLLHTTDIHQYTDGSSGRPVTGWDTESLWGVDSVSKGTWQPWIGERIKTHHLDWADSTGGLKDDDVFGPDPIPYAPGQIGDGFTEKIGTPQVKTTATRKTTRYQWSFGYATDPTDITEYSGFHETVEELSDEIGLAQDLSSGLDGTGITLGDWSASPHWGTSCAEARFEKNPCFSYLKSIQEVQYTWIAPQTPSVPMEGLEQSPLKVAGGTVHWAEVFTPVVEDNEPPIDPIPSYFSWTANNGDRQSPPFYLITYAAGTACLRPYTVRLDAYDVRGADLESKADAEEAIEKEYINYGTNSDPDPSGVYVLVDGAADASTDASTTLRCAHIDLLTSGGQVNAGWESKLTWNRSELTLSSYDDDGNLEVHQPPLSYDGEVDRHFIVTAKTIPNWTRRSVISLEVKDEKGRSAGNGMVNIYIVRKLPEAARWDERMPISDAVGPRYRKIGLNGRPLSDSKPQNEAETDEAKEETYVDAFNLNLRHSVTDIYLPIPGSELALSARRNVQSEIWNLRSGLRPHERLDLPFGPGWSTNLVSYIEFVDYSSVSIEQPNEAFVHDETGSVHHFVKYTSSGVDRWVPFASGKHEGRAFLTDLKTVGNEWVFTQKYGNTLYFPKGSGSQAGQIVYGSVAENRLDGSSGTVTYAYARLDRVVDRLGYRLVYRYRDQDDVSHPNPSTLIPYKIFAKKPDDGNAGTDETLTGLQLFIQQDGQKRITQIWDPMDNVVSYGFEYKEVLRHPVTAQIQPIYFMVSAEVRDPAGTLLRKTGYRYNNSNVVVTEPETIPRPANTSRAPFHHIDVTHIINHTSAVPAEDTETTWSFAYQFDHTKKIFVDAVHAQGYFSQDGLPRWVSAIQPPTGVDPVQFENLSSIHVESMGTQNNLVGDRQTRVTDSLGSAVTYTFLDNEILILTKFRDFYHPGSNPPDTFYNPRLVYFKTMEISYGSAGKETFTFEPAAGLALKSLTDLSGNVTTFAYANELSAPQWLTDIYPSGSLLYKRWDDVTSQTNALGKTRSFTYSDNFRIMDSITDEMGRYTRYDVDSKGRRYAERVFLHKPGTGEIESTLCVKETATTYHSLLPGFVTQRTVKRLNASDPGWAADLITTFAPDTLGRVASQSIDAGQNANGQDQDPLVTQYTYDRNGNRTSVTDPLGKVTVFTYDGFNRLTQTTYHNWDFEDRTYDLRGNLILQHTGSYSSSSFSSSKNLLRESLFEYDAANRKIQAESVVSFSPRKTDKIRSGYNAVGSLIQVIDGRNYQTEYFYDSLQRLIRKKDANNQNTYYEYDLTKNAGASGFDSSAFKPTRITDARGYVTEFIYDDLYRLQQTRAEWNKGDAFAETTNTYDDAGNLTDVTDPLNKVTHTDYDALNRPVGVTSAYGTNYATTTATAYTSTGFAWKSSFAGAADSQWSAGDKVAKEIETRYDLAGRPIQVTYPEAVSGEGRAVEKTFYDAAGNIIRTVDPRSTASSVIDCLYSYDDRHRRIKEELPSVLNALTGSSARPTTTIDNYRADGLKTSATDAKGKTTTFDYDALGRLTQTVFPDSLGSVTTKYDPNGNILEVTDPENKKTVNTYDRLNHLETTTNAKGIKIAYAYDASGNRIAVTDGKQQKTRFTYDGLGRLTTEVDPTNKKKSFFYDAVNKTREKDSLGQITDYQYDDHHRLSHVLHSGAAAENLNYTYDAAGNLLSAAPPSPNQGSVVATTYTYDARNKRRTETSAGVTHTYGYDLAGNRTSVSTAGTAAFLVCYQFDGACRLFKVIQGTNASDPTTEYQYDLNGNTYRLILPNGEKILTTHDALNRVLTRQGYTPANALAYTFTYVNDKAGNVTQIKENYADNRLPGRVIDNVYDDAYRLEKETIASAAAGTGTPPTGASSTVKKVVTDYGYDTANNRATRKVTTTVDSTEATVSTVYTYNSLNQLTKADDASHLVSFDYDLNGNRIRRTSQVRGGSTPPSPTLTTYHYDRNNRLVDVIEGGAERLVEINAEGQIGTKITASYYIGGTRHQYRYDHRTRRVERTEPASGGGTATTRVTFAGGVSVAEYPGSSSTPDVRYVRGMDIGGGVGGMLYSLRSGTASYSHYNARGDVVARTDGSGTATYSAAYEAFGTTPEKTGTNPDRFAANSKEQDPTGLLNEGFRCRDLETGVFLTRDPAGFVDGPNMYTYVVQNPWSKFDPEGLSEDDASGTSNLLNWFSSFFVSDNVEIVRRNEPEKTEEQRADREQVKGAIIRAGDGLKKIADAEQTLIKSTPILGQTVSGWEIVTGLDIGGGPISRVDASVDMAAGVVAGKAAGFVLGKVSGAVLGTSAQFVTKETTEEVLAAENAAIKPGSFSILDWKGSPSSIPKPAGPFRLLEGAEYSAARAEANAANRAMHAADESLGGWQLHEIQPVKFGGSPTDIANKMPLPAGAHSEVTTWWNTLMRDLTRKPGAP